MKHFVRLMFVAVSLLATFVVFKVDILSLAKESWFSYEEDKAAQVSEGGRLVDFQDETYWDGDTFFLSKYAEDLGFVLVSDEREGQSAVWRCGARRFAIDDDGNMWISVVGDEWDDLTAKNDYVIYGYSIDYGNGVIRNVNEETVLYFASSMLNLRKNDNLRDVAGAVRADIDNYHTMKKGAF